MIVQPFDFSCCAPPLADVSNVRADEKFNQGLPPQPSRAQPGDNQKDGENLPGFGGGCHVAITDGGQRNDR